MAQPPQSRSADTHTNLITTPVRALLDGPAVPAPPEPRVHALPEYLPFDQRSIDLKTIIQHNSLWLNPSTFPTKGALLIKDH